MRENKMEGQKENIEKWPLKSDKWRHAILASYSRFLFKVVLKPFF